MFRDECEAIALGARNKINFLKSNGFGYFIASMLAGIYVGFGVVLMCSIGGMLGDAPYSRIMMGMFFGIALSLVIAAGAELFTGNNMAMVIGVVRKTVSVGQMLWLWLVCFLGNWVGSVLLGALFWQSGLVGSEVGNFIGTVSNNKMSLSPWELFIRGILCNTLVCLATWCSFRLKSDSGKLIMVFWCIFAFITTGFEHSIANMSLMTVALLGELHSGVTLAGYLYNIFYVTLGNMVGGIAFVAAPYLLISSGKKA
jgi:Formate/nitrite family of transporters